MHTCPAGNGEQHIVGALAAIKNIHAVNIKIHNLNLRVVLPEIVPQPIHIMTPATMHQQQVFTMKVGKLQSILYRQPMMNGHCTLKWRAYQFQSGTAAQCQHGFVKNAAHDVDTSAQIAQNLPGIFQ